MSDTISEFFRKLTGGNKKPLNTPLSAAIGGNTNATETVPTRRGFEDYLYQLNLTEDELRDKKILDLGGPMNDIFAKEAEAKGIKVFTVNPKLIQQQYAHETTTPTNNLKPTGRAIAALAQNLPYPNETFDLVLAVESIPEYLKDNEEEYRKTFSEITRVLKSGGKAIINVSVFLNKKMLERYQKIFSEINKEYKVSYRFPSIEENKVTPERMQQEDFGQYTDMIIQKE